MLANDPIHKRLGHGGCVLLVMPEFSEADDINDNILFKLHAVINGQLRYEDNRFGVVSIHVKDWRLDHLDHIGAING